MKFDFLLNIKELEIFYVPPKIVKNKLLPFSDVFEILFFFFWSTHIHLQNDSNTLILAENLCFFLSKH